jgi:hypothetical protein
MQGGKELEKSTKRLRDTTQHKNHFDLTTSKPVENYKGEGVVVMEQNVCFTFHITFVGNIFRSDKYVAAYGRDSCKIACTSYVSCPLLLSRC